MHKKDVAEVSVDLVNLFQRKHVDFVPNVVMKTVHRAGGKFTNKDNPNAESKEVPVMGIDALKAHHEWKMIKSPKKSPSPKKRRTTTSQKTAPRKTRSKRTLTLNAQQIQTSTAPNPDDATPLPDSGKGRKKRAKNRDHRRDG